MDEKMLYKDLSYKLQGMFFGIRNDLGSGRKEIVYQKASERELKQSGIIFEREPAIKIYSNKGVFLGVHRPDFLADNKIVIELKAILNVLKLEIVRVYGYLRNGEHKLVYLVNFASPKLYIRRFIFTNDRKQWLKRAAALFVAICLFSFIAICGAHPVFAADITVSPVIIDEKGKARDILNGFVTITNVSGRKQDIYAAVNNVSEDEGKQEFKSLSGADLATSLANWILFPRGVIELMPGESKKIDFKIEINVRAEPGEYHAIIVFGAGSSASEAEKTIGAVPSLSINVEVLDDAKEQMQIKEFKTEKTISWPPAAFSYVIENIGNRPQTPGGEIRLYNRRGKEIAVLKINEKKIIVEPNATVKLTAVWEGGQGFGKYKAFLNLTYGEKQRGILQDTIYFWVLPERNLALLIIGLILGNFLFAALWYFAYEKYAKRRTAKKGGYEKK